MSFGRCEKCGEYVWTNSHSCLPWEVWMDGEEEEDARTVYATSVSQAAEKYAHDDDWSGSTPTFINSEQFVCVKGIVDGEEARWRLLVIDCLEERLGRELARADFTECLLNDGTLTAFDEGRSPWKLAVWGYSG